MATSIQDTFNAPFVFRADWKSAFEDEEFVKVFSSDILENYILKKRWYGGKASTLKYIEVVDYFKIASEKNTYYGVLIEVNYKEAFLQHYFMPVAFMAEDELDTKTLIAPVTLNGQEGYLVDALHQEDFRRLVFESIVNGAKNDAFNVKYHKGKSLSKETKYVSSRFMGIEQSNTSIIYNDNLVLKFFRRIYVSTNPDYEISRFLTERMKFKHTPAYKGSINVAMADDNITLGLMQELVPNQGDAWKYMLEAVDGVFDNLNAKKIKIDKLPDLELFKTIKMVKFNV